jgi:hypothetical protein
MAEEYKRVNLHPFPLDQFSESIYQTKVKGDDALPSHYLAEIECMEHHKMVVSRQRRDDRRGPVRHWSFRHDKIQDFFLMQTFLGTHQERRYQHQGESLFRGVYFLLALYLPLQEAEELHDRLIDYAADTKDHTVSDTFHQLLRSRKAINNIDLQSSDVS